MGVHIYIPVVLAIPFTNIFRQFTCVSRHKKCKNEEYLVLNEKWVCLHPASSAFGSRLIRASVSCVGIGRHHLHSESPPQVVRQTADSGSRNHPTASNRPL